MSKIRLTDLQRMAIAEIVNNYLYDCNFVICADTRILKRLSALGLININIFNKSRLKFAYPTNKLKSLLLGYVDLYEITDLMILRSLRVNEDEMKAHIDWAGLYEERPRSKETARAHRKFRDLSVDNCVAKLEGSEWPYDENEGDEETDEPSFIHVIDIPRTLET